MTQQTIAPATDDRKERIAARIKGYKDQAPYVMTPTYALFCAEKYGPCTAGANMHHSPAEAAKGRIKFIAGYYISPETEDVYVAVMKSHKVAQRTPDLSRAALAYAIGWTEEDVADWLWCINGRASKDADRARAWVKVLQDKRAAWDKVAAPVRAAQAKEARA